MNMHRFPHIVALWFCLALTGISFAQSIPSDSAIALPETQILADRIKHSHAGLNTSTYDSLLQAYPQGNLADFLTRESPMFIKSYGLGSLATTAFRGGSAYHTAVLWNGISLSSPMNGLLDLSLVPLAAAKHLELQHGGSTALFGSGAVAGVLKFSSQPSLGQGFSLEADLSVGSFSDFRQELGATWSKKRFASSLRIFHASAQNDFSFTNPYLGNERSRQTHAELRNLGLVTDHIWSPGKGHSLSLNAWLQRTERNLPPTLLQSISRAKQEDQALRLHAAWKYQKGPWETHLRTAYVHETLLYQDSLSDIYSLSLSHQWINEAEAKVQLHPNHSLQMGWHGSFALASHPSFAANPEQFRTALFASYSYRSKNRKWHAQASGRGEIWAGKVAPPTFSVGLDYRLFPWLKLRANGSKLYRIPTFNDLYWVPGGNPELKPEEGYALEGGLDLHVKYRKFTFRSSLTAFHRDIDHWILWLPGTSFWSPQNLRQVWSRGMETQTDLSYRNGKWSIGLNLSTQYVVSTNQKALGPNDLSVGKQLMYTPVYSGGAGLSLAYGGLSLGYRHQYTGYRYTSTDNTQFLSPFDLGSVQLSYLFPFKSHRLRAHLSINNVWNSDYLVLANRPMPGIQWMGGISIRLQKPNN